MNEREVVEGINHKLTRIVDNSGIHSRSLSGVFGSSPPERSIHTAGDISMKRSILSTVVATTVWFSGAGAMAEVIINLENSGSTTFNQGLVTSITISGSNAGVDPLTLGYLQWGIQLVPQGDVTGSLAASSFSAPATGSPWSDPTVIGPVVATLTEGDINGLSGYYLMSITENDLPNVGTIQPGQSRNLATVSITAPNDAFGTWLLYVVNETDSDNNQPLTSITTDTFDSVQFANLLAPAAPNAGVAFLAATLIVVPAPPGVPEIDPAGIVSVLALIGGGLGLLERRRKRAGWSRAIAIQASGAGSISG